MPRCCQREFRIPIPGTIVFVLSVLQVSVFIADFQELGGSYVDWLAFGIVQLVFASISFFLVLIMTCTKCARSYATTNGMLIMWREATLSSVTSICQASFFLAYYSNRSATKHCEGAFFPFDMICTLFAIANLFYLVSGPALPETFGT